MSDYLFSVFLGIVEGLTEFLPVSSTAHLRIVEAIAGTNLTSEYWKAYSVIIQLGAILAVAWLFWQRLWSFARTFPRGSEGKHNLFTHPLTLIMVAFVCTAGPAYLLNKKIGDNLENLWIIGAALIIGGIVMWVVDRIFTRVTINRTEDMSIYNAITIGIVQIASAVFPGTSRSMATIAAGQVCGMSRSAALEFSFFVSIPTMFAACGYKMLMAIKLFRHDPATWTTGGPGNAWLTLAIGFVVSFIVAALVVKWFTAWVRQHGFVSFAVYRIVLGVGLLIWAWKTNQ